MTTGTPFRRAAVSAAVLLALGWWSHVGAQRAPLSVLTPEPMRYESPDEAPVNSWWLPTGDGGLIVFDALRTITDALGEVSALQKSGRPVRAILLTHPHPDHVTGLATLKNAFPKAPVYSTAEAVSYLQGKGKTLLAMNVEARGQADATKRIPQPDILLHDGQRLMISGVEIEVKSLGTGESPAATVYFVPSMNTLVVGDVMTPGRVPLLAAGHTAAWLKQIENLRRSYRPSTRILPGHGPATLLQRAAGWQEQYIEAFRREVERATRKDTEGGPCVTAEEGRRILADVRRQYPTHERVARMPAEALDALNLEGVGWELTGHACPGAPNPIR